MEKVAIPDEVRMEIVKEFQICQAILNLKMELADAEGGGLDVVSELLSDKIDYVYRLLFKGELPKTA
ncbi:MAG: hypothetical protein LBB59_02925 [Campylobacteraceae bacterium]|jgi:hypothetical protein|nr:hypothetical protein [Campylobacteraceae bacterium]